MKFSLLNNLLLLTLIVNGFVLVSACETTDENTVLLEKDTALLGSQAENDLILQETGDTDSESVGLDNSQNDQFPPMEPQMEPEKENSRIYNGTKVLATSSELDDVNRAIVGLDKRNMTANGDIYSGGTGILIAPRLVLTVGHVGGHLPANLEDVNFAAANGSGFVDSSVASLQDIIVRREVDWEDTEPTMGDIGIWVLDYPSNVALPYYNLSSNFGDDMIFFGFGTENHSVVNRGPLRRAECDTVSGPTNNPADGEQYRTDCGSIFNDNIIGEKGDSGGPVFTSNLELAGLHSGSDDPANENEVMDINHYKSWIDGIIDDYKTDLLTGDFDGDGRSDLFYWNRSYKGNWVDLSKNGVPDGIADPVTFPVSTNPRVKPVCKYPNELKIGDFTGDGQDDLLCVDGDSSPNFLCYRWAKNDGTFDTGCDVFWTTWCDGEILVGDFNDDGYADLHCRQDDGWRKVMLNTKNTAAPFTGSSSWKEQNSWCGQELYVGDFNDDDRDDLLCWDFGKTLYIKFATASGTFADAHVKRSTAWCGSSTNLKTRFVADFDNDGMDDIMCWSQAGNAYYIDYAADGSFPFMGTDHYATNFPWCGDEQKPGVANINGGSDDLTCYDQRTGQVWINYNDTGSTPIFAGYDTDLRIPDVPLGLWP